MPDFSPSHYDKLIYTTTGLTQRVRPDLTGPDGRPGVDLRGYTVKNHYREMSKGAYEPAVAGPVLQRRLRQAQHPPRGEDLFFRDIDASVVVPSRDHRRYTTRIVDADGNPLDTPVEDLSLGVEFVVRRVAGNNRRVVIGVRAARAEDAP